MIPAPVSLGEVGDDLASVIGREQTLRLIAALPPSGSRPWRKCVYIPKRLPVDHQLVRILGYRDAARLARVFGGMILQPSIGAAVARAALERSIAQRRAEGFSAAAISVALGMPRSTVASIIARIQT